MKAIARLSLAALACLLCSCAGLVSFFASPAGQVVVQLGAIGLEKALEKGKVKEGDRIAIKRGVAIVTSADTAKVKTFKLADLGLQAALDHQLVKEGDAILIQEATAIIRSAVIPVTAAKAPSAPVQ